VSNESGFVKNISYTAVKWNEKGKKFS
jgi:hypothetical protein